MSNPEQDHANVKKIEETSPSKTTQFGGNFGMEPKKTPVAEGVRHSYYDNV